MVYYYIFGILAVWSFFDLIQIGRYIRFLPIIGLICFIALRSWNVGLDTIRYVNDYNQIKWGFNSIQNFEKGFQFIEKLSQSLQLPVWGFFAIVATLSIGSIVFAYGKYTEIPMVAFLYYYSRFFLNRDMNQIRSGIASAILLFSIKYISERKFWKFFFIVIIATQFHSAAIISILVYPMVLMIDKIKKHGTLIYILSLVVSGIASYLVLPLLNIVFKLIGRGSVYISYTGYVDGLGLANPVIILQVLISVVLSYLYFKFESKGKYADSILGMYMLSTILLVLFSGYSVLSGRLSTVLATVEPLVLIFILKYFIKNKVIVPIVIMVSLIVFWIMFIQNGQIQTVFEPYYFSFE